MDCYWQPQSSLAAVPEQAVLFDRLQETVALPHIIPKIKPAIAAIELDERIAGGIGFAWLMFSIAAKYLARDPAFDMGLMFYPRPGLQESAALLGQAGALTPKDWAVPQEPLEKVARLGHLVSKAEQFRLSANATGFTLSPLYAPCLFRYLDMVAGILRSHGN